MTCVVCLGCGWRRPYDADVESSPGECPICVDVSWTYSDDADDDPQGVAECIERRRQSRESGYGVDLVETLRGRVHVVA